jgi:hypothetical protein
MLVRRACEAGRWDIIRVLMKDKRINMGVYENVCIRTAAACGEWEIVQQLLQVSKASNLHTILL